MSLVKLMTPPVSDYEDYSQKYSKSSRIGQFIEALTVYGLVMIFLWVFWWEQSPLHNYTIASGGLVLLVIWMLIISPLIHHDTPKDWGKGSIIDYFQHMLGRNRNRKPGEPIIKVNRMIAIIFFILFQIAVVGALILFYGKVAAEAQSWLNGLLEDLRVQQGFGFSLNIGVALVVALLLIELIVFSLFRYDNFRKSFKEFIKMAIICMPVYIVVLLVYYYGAGPNTWTYEGDPFTIEGFLVGWLGYIVWGTIQQLLFLGYFNTRMRKAMLGYEWKYAKWAPMITAFINACLFGMIHIPSLLGVFTFIGGFLWTWYFQKKGNQNLLVAGIFHGLFGTLLGTYLKFIPFSVGPQQITL